MTKRIALDAGHGLFTYGKQDPTGVKEWTFNDKVLRACVTHLVENYEGFEILRLDDPTGRIDVPLLTRSNKANNWKADILVSIHHNANTGKWGDWGGVETFVQTPLASNPNSHNLARQVHPEIVKAMLLRDRGIKPNNLHMTREPKMPSILTEGGFMDSRTDNPVMKDDNKLRAQGIGIAEGIAKYLSLKKKPVLKPSEPVIVPTEKVGTATMLVDAQAYKEPRFDAPFSRVYIKGTVRNIYLVQNGWYLTFSGDWIPSRSGTNFTYVPVNVIEPEVSKEVFRVVAGSFLTKESAEKRAEELKTLGVDTFITPKEL